MFTNVWRRPCSNTWLVHFPFEKYGFPPQSCFLLQICALPFKSAFSPSVIKPCATTMRKSRRISSMKRNRILRNHNAQSRKHLHNLSCASWPATSRVVYALSSAARKQQVGVPSTAHFPHLTRTMLTVEQQNNQFWHTCPHRTAPYGPSCLYLQRTRLAHDYG